MITKYNSGQILKGSDVEINVALTTCKKNIDVRDAEDLVVSIFTTEGGDAIQKTIEDIELNEQGNAGTIHIDWEELDMLDDGVIRTNIFYVYEGDDVELESTTGYYLKTPIDYTPMTFVTEENLDELVDEKISEEGMATEDYVNSAITEATEGMATEDYVNSAVTQATSGLASETYVNSAITEAISGIVIDDYCYFTQGYTQPWNVRNIDDLIDWANQYPDDYQKLRVFISCDGRNTNGYREFHIISLSSAEMRLYSNLEGDYHRIGEVYIGTLYKGRGSVPEDWGHFFIDTEEYLTSGDTALAISQAVEGLASEDYVNSAVTEATEGLASEDYVNSAISEEVPTIFLASNDDYFDTPATEVNRLLDFLAALDNFEKARVFIKVRGGYVEFRPVALGTYDGLEAVNLYGVFQDNANGWYNTDILQFYHGWLQRGRSIQQNQPFGGLKESTITASEAGVNSNTYTYILPSTNNVEEKRAIIAKAIEYQRNGKDYSGIRVVYGGHVYRVEQCTTGGEYDNVSCTCLDASYMYNSKVYIRVIDFNTDMAGSILSRTEEINLAIFATTADTAALQTQIENMPSSSAMTEAIEEATSGLASETYVNSAITQATSGLASENYVNSAITQATSGLATEQYVQSAITSSNLVYALTSANKIWAGPRLAYSAQTIDNTTLYFITD